MNKYLLGALCILFVFLFPRSSLSEHQGTLNPECAACHEVNLFRQHGGFSGAVCAGCHDSQQGAVRATIVRGKRGEVTCCVDCHGPIDHSLAHDQTFLLSESCAACHVANVALEHGGRGLDCTICHTSLSPQVQGAIELGRSGVAVYCDACHGQTGENGHTSTHEIAGQSALPSADCALCHLANIVTEHQSRSLSCQACHASTDPTVQAAIANGVAGTLATCDACHGQTGEGGHTLAHERAGESALPPGGPMGADCGNCHQANVVTEHLGRGLSCGTCHASINPTVQAAIANGIAGPLATCDSCHLWDDYDLVHHTLPKGCLECHCVHGC